MRTSHDTVDQFIERNGIEFDRSKSSQSERVIDCPMCGKQKHLYVNRSTFLWHCKRCDARGGESALKRAMGLQYEVESPRGRDDQREADERFARDMLNLRDSTDIQRWSSALMSSAASGARAYLEGRGIPIDVAQRYGLGWAAKPDGSTGMQRLRRQVPGAEDKTEPTPGWVVIPAFTRWDENRMPDRASAAVVKLRSVPPLDKDFRRLVGGTSVLYAPAGIDHSSTLVIVGGELDALSLVVAGWQNVVAATTGEAAWDDAWTTQLEDVADIVVIYDNDEVGRKGAASVAEKLGPHRVRIGQWPPGCKDANEALQNLGAGHFDVRRIVESAKSAFGETVVRVSSIRQSYIDQLRGSTPRGISTGWEDLDSLFGGVRNGEVTLVTGDTASGKSTFTAQWALNMAVQNVPTLFCPFELGVTRQLDKWVRQWSQLPPDTLSDAKLYSTLDAIEGMPIWLLNRYGSINVEAMRNTMTYSIRRFGVRFVVVDHIHFMVDEGPSERSDLDAMMKMLAEVAVNTGIHIVVVAHPRQSHSSDDKHRDNRIIQLADLKGSSGLKQVADNVLSVWRPRKADRTGVASSGFGTANVYLLKVRSDYANEGSVNFKYIINSSRFEPPDPAMLQAIQDAMSQSDSGPGNDENRPRRRRVGPPKPGHESIAQSNPTHWTEVNDD